MKLTTDARAILYVIDSNPGTPTPDEIGKAVSLSRHAVRFILEQMKQNDLAIECAGRFTLSHKGAELVNDLR